MGECCVITEYNLRSDFVEHSCCRPAVSEELHLAECVVNSFPPLNADHVRRVYIRVGTPRLLYYRHIGVLAHDAIHRLGVRLRCGYGPTVRRQHSICVWWSLRPCSYDPVCGVCDGRRDAVPSVAHTGANIGASGGRDPGTARGVRGNTGLVRITVATDVQ